MIRFFYFELLKEAFFAINTPIDTGVKSFMASFFSSVEVSTSVFMMSFLRM